MPPEKICVGVFFNKTLLKKTPTQVFCCEFCELFKNAYFVWSMYGGETFC